MVTREARLLLSKELQQVLRNRGALLSSTLLPLLFLAVLPLSFLPALLSYQPGGVSLLPAQLIDPQHPGLAYTHLLLPLFLTLCGVMVPAAAATHTVVAERERGTLELLVALPVRVQDILVAKLLATLIFSAAIVIPLFLSQAGLLLSLGLATTQEVVLLFALLVAALLCSVGEALLLALVARDFRTASNLNVALIMPLLLLSAGVLTLLPGDAGLVVLTVVLGAFALLCGFIAMRWLTFERYLA